MMGKEGRKGTRWDRTHESGHVPQSIKMRRGEDDDEAEALPSLQELQHVPLHDVIPDVERRVHFEASMVSLEVEEGAKGSEGGIGVGEGRTVVLVVVIERRGEALAGAVEVALQDVEDGAGQLAVLSGVPHDSLVSQKHVQHLRVHLFIRLFIYSMYVCTMRFFIRSMFSTH